MKTLLHKSCFVLLLIVIAFNTHAQDNIDSLKKVLLTEKDDTNKVKTLDRICGYYIDGSDYENTMQNAKAMLALSTKINYKKGMADSYLNIGSAYNLKKDHYNEDAYFNKALALYKQTKDTQKIIRCYDWMSFLYTQDNEASKAFASIYTEQKIREKTGDKKTIADGFLRIAMTFMNAPGANAQGQLKNDFSALKLYKELNDKKGISTAQLYIGRAYLDQNKSAEALNKFTDALQVIKDSGTLEDIGNIFGSIGEAYEDQGDSAFDKGNKNLAAKKYIEAEKNYFISLRTWQALHSNQAAWYYRSLGHIDIKLKKLNAAKKYLDSSLVIFQSFGSGPKGATAGIYEDYAQIDSMQGNYKDAYKNYELYKIYYDSANDEEDAKKTVQVQMQYDFDKKEAAAKAAQDKKDADAKRIKNQQLFITTAFGIVMLAVVIIAVIQFRNNRNKQKANLALQQQKQKVESTLQELKSTQAQLIQSEKMASLGELTAGIAHEIQNPLNFVNNFSEVNKEMIDELQTELKSGNTEEAIAISNDIKENEEKINHHGKRADAIVKGMLQHSRQTSGTKEPTDINALCDEYLRLSYHGLRAKDKEFNADIKTDFDKSIGKINIVPQDIGRVLLNLFNNAFYAVSEKQKTAGENYKPLVTVATKSPSPLEKGWVEVIVSDNGNGIPANIIDKIFQPFLYNKTNRRRNRFGFKFSLRYYY